ncbi:ParA family protein [Halorarum halobium]|uniref:ParA family protein n=1 Tax=Halorarum halobium TaxID=3075121 RepID=UPI0028A94306|nr:ParA family protein [Halobaculum sp. XH14]
MTRTLALVGVAGGVGTTRTLVESAATLARDGRDVVVLDAAYATQGLSEFLGGRIDPDLTALCLSPDRPLADGLYDLELGPGVDDAPGRVALAPAFAPFERLARAKTTDAAEAFEDRVAEAATAFDHVLVDTPPVGANQHLAAVNAVDRVVLVAPGTEHGADARRRMVDRLRDVGTTPAMTVAVGGPLPAASATVPDLPGTPAEGVQCLDDDALGGRMMTAVESLLDTSLAVEFEDDGALGKVKAGVEELRGRAED